MSVLLIFENKNPKPWKKILDEKLTNTKVEIYPNVEDKSAIDFIVCWKPKKNLFKEFPNIKIIQSVGASIDHITNSQEIDQSVIITRIIDNQLSNDMWEYLLSIVLSQIKNLSFYQKQQKDYFWEQKEYQSVNNTTICILGLGKIGKYVSEKFAELGFKVKGWSNSKKEILNVKSFSGKKEFSECLKKSNFLINLLPLTNETKDILNKSSLEKLAKSCFLINVGRGEHLVDNDLIVLLNNNHISGALLDVFREEPLPKNNQFWHHPKILITPHIASLTNIESAVNQIIENHYRFTQNKELLNIVSLKKGY